MYALAAPDHDGIPSENGPRRPQPAQSPGSLWNRARGGVSQTQRLSKVPKLQGESLLDGSWFYYCIDKSDNGVRVVEHNLEDRQASGQRCQIPPEFLYAQSLLKAYSDTTSWWYRFLTMTACYSASLAKVYTITSR